MREWEEGGIRRGADVCDGRWQTRIGVRPQIAVPDFHYDLESSENAVSQERYPLLSQNSDSAAGRVIRDMVCALKSTDSDAVSPCLLVLLPPLLTPDSASLADMYIDYDEIGREG
jgi:hypothetical protein